MLKDLPEQLSQFYLRKSNIEEYLSNIICFFSWIEKEAKLKPGEAGSDLLKSIELKECDYSKSFIKKFKAKDNEEFVRFMCEPLRATVDHLDLYSNGGEDADNNYLLCCKGCNNLRDCFEIKEWLNLNPNFPSHIFESIDELGAKMPETSYKKEVSEHINRLISS